MKEKQLIADYLDAQRAMFDSAQQLQAGLGLDDEKTDEKNGWTLSMWLYQSPLYTEQQVKDIIKKFK